MKKLVTIGIFALAFLSFFSGFLMIFLYPDILVGIITMFSFGVICLVAGTLFVKMNIHIEPKPVEQSPKVNKPKKVKPKKEKKPFISDKEWEELEEEDEEMIFLDDD